MQGNLFNKIKDFLGKESGKDEESKPEEINESKLTSEQSVPAELSEKANEIVSTNHVAEKEAEQKPVHSPEEINESKLTSEQSVPAELSEKANETVSTNHFAEKEAEQKPAHSPEEIKEEVIKVLKTCYDPEIPVDVFELGLIYDIKVATNGDVLIVMTLTSPSCPVAGILPNEIEQKVREHPWVRESRVELTFDPPWNQRMMSEVAMLELGFL